MRSELFRLTAREFVNTLTLNLQQNFHMKRKGVETSAIEASLAPLSNLAADRQTSHSASYKIPGTLTNSRHHNSTLGWNFQGPGIHV
jgi:hypothetical protein